MAYHEAFWVTVGTAAPVIGLAHGVALWRNTVRVTAAQSAQSLAKYKLKLRRELEMERLSHGRRLKEDGMIETAVDTLQQIDHEEETHALYEPGIKENLRTARVVDVTVFISWLICAVTFGGALLSLAILRDLWPTPVIAGALVVPMISLCAHALNLTPPTMEASKLDE